jgi:hypothetical protein
LTDRGRVGRSKIQTWLKRDFGLCAANRLSLRNGLTAPELARCIELASHGFGFQKANAGALGDLERSIRLLVAGAVAETAQATKPQSLRSRP